MWKNNYSVWILVTEMKLYRKFKDLLGILSFTSLSFSLLLFKLCQLIVGVHSSCLTNQILTRSPWTNHLAAVKFKTTLLSAAVSCHYITHGACSHSLPFSVLSVAASWGPIPQPRGEMSLLHLFSCCSRLLVVFILTAIMQSLGFQPSDWHTPSDSRKFSASASSSAFLTAPRPPHAHIHYLMFYAFLYCSN